MYLLKVTLGTGATPIIPEGDLTIQRSSSFQSIILGATAHSYNFGDATVSAGSGGGIPVPTTSPPVVISPALGYTATLSECFLIGTSGDVVPVIVFP